MSGKGHFGDPFLRFVETHPTCLTRKDWSLQKEEDYVGDLLMETVVPLLVRELDERQIVSRLKLEGH